MEETHIEIERRWLVHEIHGNVLCAKPSFIKQGYFSTGGQNQPRIRIQDGRATLTKKHGKGKMRCEVNYDIADMALAERLYEDACKYRCPKHRRMHEGWEIDSITLPLDRVILVEREFPTEDTDVGLPPWFKGIEVTDATCNLHGISLGSRDVAIIRHCIENKIDPATRGNEFKKKFNLVLDAAAKLKVY